MKNTDEMKNNATENKDLAPDMEARIRELEEAVKRARSHKESCDCEDCETKKGLGLSRLKGFGKKIGGFFVSTEPLKTEEVSEAEAEEIEDEVEDEKTETEDEAEVEKVDADAEKTEDDAKKADADTEKTESKTEETEVEDEAEKTAKVKCSGFKAKKKENFFLELFYTDSGKILSATDMEKIKKLPIGGDIHVKAVKRFMLELDGGFIFEVEKIPSNTKNREFLHVASKTLVSKDEAELYKSLGSNPKEDPIVKVIDVKALIADDNGLMKYVNI